MAVERIEALKEMHLTTDLCAGAQIAAPEGPEWQAVAARLQGVLRNATGAPMAQAAGYADLKDRHLVALGHAMNNPVVMALYRRKYAFVDDFYPGGDGYVLRTVHNPEGMGHNALIVGAGTPEGARAAVDRLEAMLGDGRLGYVNVAQSETHRALLPDFTPEVFRERMEAGFRGNAGRGPIEQGITLGLAHHFTHDMDCARMFRDVLFYYEDLVKNRYDGVWCFEHMLFIYAWTWRLFYVWDLIEESDAFTDAERLRMTNLLWGLTQYVAGLPYFRGETPPVMEIRQNHSTFAALSMSFSAGYFRTYYGLGGFEKHLSFCEAIFDGQADCYKPNDDGGGGGYCWLVPNHLMTYDFKQDEDRFLEGGHLRLLADYAIAISDNLGSSVGFGDVGSYGTRRKTSALVSETMCKAAWYYNEGGYLWALDWLGGAPVHGCYYRDVPKRVPEWMTGVVVAPFNPPMYDWVVRHTARAEGRQEGAEVARYAPGGVDVPLAEAFDKLTLREGFGEDDLYLLLDGTSTFAHGHDDENSIERLTWKGRMWLAETDYIWRRPRHHSSVVSICDGESLDMPPLAALKWAEDLGDAAFVRTVVAGYNGVDWTRDMFWVKGRFLLVADSLALLRDADYDLRCLWRTLGEVSLDASGMTVAQQGVFFRMLNADDSDKALETEASRVAGQDPYAGYEFATGPIRIFKQQKALCGQAGGVERYFNLMVAGAQDEVDAWRMARIAENAVRIEGPGGAWVFGTGDGSVAARAGDRVLQPAKCAGAMDGLERVDAYRAYVHRRMPKANRFQATGKTAFAPVWALGLQGAVRCLDAGEGLVGVGTTGGDVAVVNARGQALWKANLGAEVRTVQVTGSGGALAGGRDCRLTRFAGDGAVAWRRAFAASHGRDQIVNAVCTADVTGTGESAILVATDGWLVWALTQDGEEMWQRQIQHHAAQTLVVDDVEGDGRQEILVGTEYYNSNLLEADGRIRWTIRGGPCFAALALADLNGDGLKEAVYGSMDGHVYVFHPVTGALLWKANLGDDVRHGIVVPGGFAAGSESGNVVLLSPDGQKRWRRDLDAPVTGLVTWGDGGVVASTAAGWVVVLSDKGEVAGHWRADAGVTALALSDGPGLVAGLENGRVVGLGGV